MKRKIYAFCLSLALALTLLPLTASAASRYTDVPNSWAEKAIDKWSDLGILTGGDGKFRPEDPITRGELAVILDRIMQYQTAATNAFTDLGQEFYTNAILKANAAGVMTGDGPFVRPTAPLTKEEAAVLLGKALGLAESTAASGFTDSAGISPWAIGYVNALAARGFIHGYQGVFKPQSSITRAELVTILDGAISRLYSKPAAYTGDVKGIALVNTAGVVLEDMTINGDLIFAEGIGSGDVILKNVTVTGDTIVRGGGSNSIYIQGNSRLKKLIIEKTDDGQIRIVSEAGAVIDAVFINDGNDDIVLTGAFKSVTLSADVPVKAVGAAIDAMTINAARAALDLDKTSSVGTLTLDAAIAVHNNGTITQAVINVDGVTIDGNDPVDVLTATGVQGGEVKAPVGGGGSGGGGGGGGGSGGQTDTDKVAAAKTAISGGTYTKLPVSDVNDQTLKTAAVQAVVQTLQGETTAIVTYHSETATYDVAIRMNTASDSVRISATFVETPPSFSAGYPKVNLGTTVFQTVVKTNRTATYFYLAYQQDKNRSAPQAEDIITGQDGTGVTTDLICGSTSVIAAQSEGSFILNNLSADTAYTVYIVARSQDGQLSAVTSLTVQTNARVTVSAPAWTVSDNRIHLNVSGLDEGKLTNMRYAYEAEFYNATGACLLNVKDVVKGVVEDISTFMNVMPANAAYLKARIVERCDWNIWDQNYLEVLSDYSMALNLTIGAPADKDKVTSITLNDETGIFTVTRDTAFVADNQYILTYTDTENAPKRHQITAFIAINWKTITFERFSNCTIGTFTFLECRNAAVNDGEASLEVSLQKVV